jgi:hypothetical protein
MTERLKNLIELARSRRMSDEEREEQIRNFAAGNAGLENSRVTRDLIDLAAARLAQDA